MSSCPAAFIVRAPPLDLRPPVGEKVAEIDRPDQRKDVDGNRAMVGEMNSQVTARSDRPRTLPGGVVGSGRRLRGGCGGRRSSFLLGPGAGGRTGAGRRRRAPPLPWPSEKLARRPRRLVQSTISLSSASAPCLVGDHVVMHPLLHRLQRARSAPARSPSRPHGLQEVRGERR